MQNYRQFRKQISNIYLNCHVRVHRVSWCECQGGNNTGVSQGTAATYLSSLSIDPHPDWRLECRMTINLIFVLSRFILSKHFRTILVVAQTGSILVQSFEALQVKKKHLILGLIVQDDLKWESQVQQIVSRATRTIWVIRNMKPWVCSSQPWSSTGAVRVVCIWN